MIGKIRYSIRVRDHDVAQINSKPIKQLHLRIRRSSLLGMRQNRCTRNAMRLRCRFENLPLTPVDAI